jgi:RNA polymerase sigma factor (sigma-70 family)
MPNVSDIDAWSGELVRRFRAGDPRSVDALVALFRPVVVRAARRHVRTNHDVEDVVQETWMAFVAHASDIREPERVVGWLRSTATNVARRQASRHARTEAVDHTTMDCSTPSFEEDVATLASDRARRHAVTTAVQQLSSIDRELVRLLTDERGLSYGTIGGLVRRPVGSIGPSRARLIDKIRRDPVVRDLIHDEATDRTTTAYQPALNVVDARV